jgi:large subunit ribosomal protein L6
MVVKSLPLWRNQGDDTMSRVGKVPVGIPKGVEITLQDQHLTVKGSQGSLQHTIHPSVELKIENNEITFVARQIGQASDALSGTTRALVSNMVKGVTEGFQRKLLLVGVGYRAQVQGDALNLTLGFSHPVNFPIPEGIKIECPTQTEIVVKGIDRQKVGQVAANIREFRPPEPYKGKGVKYSDEVIEIKETKKK